MTLLSMLQRLASSLAPVVKLPLAGIRRMPPRAKQSGADELQATAQLTVGRSGRVTSTPPSLPRRSSRPRSTLQSSAVLSATGQAISQTAPSLEASPVDQPVKQESPSSAQPAVASLNAAPAQTKPDTAHTKKRKAATRVDADADAHDPAPSVVADSKPAAGKAAAPFKEPKRGSRAAANIQPAQPTGSASTPPTEVPASTGAVGSDLQPADGPIRPAKQRKPRAKAVIDTDMTTVVQSPAKPASGTAMTSEDAATQASCAKKVRKQKSTHVKVELKSVEPGDDPATAQDAAVMSEDSATPKKPRRRRAKAEVSVEELLESVHVTPYRERVLPKKWVGAHVSMGGGMERAVVRAAAIGKFLTGCHLVAFRFCGPNQHDNYWPCLTSMPTLSSTNLHPPPHNQWFC